MLVHLVVRNEGQAGKRIKVSEPFFVIGREASCQLRSKSRSVSRKHCVIVRKKDRIYIKDLDSRNGTALNGERIESGTGCRLYHRDKLQIGKLSFRLSIRDPITELPALRPVDPSDEAQVGEFDTLSFLNNTKFRSIKQDALESKSGKRDSESEQEAENKDTESTVEVTEEEVQEALTAKSAIVESQSDEQNESEPNSSQDSEAEEEQEEGPKKLPKHLLPKSPADSKGAAQDALRKFFTGR